MFEKMNKRRTAALLVLIFIAGAVFALAERLWPEANGDKVIRDLPLTVDYSNADDGYIMIKCTASEKRYKLRVRYGDNTLTYDYNGKGDYEVFPLQFGSGTYTVVLYKQVSGNKYSEEGMAVFQASMKDPEAAFLYPNQYVNYDETTPAVLEADTLCAGMSDEKAIYDAVCNYVSRNYVYDFVKAVTAKSGEMPDIDGTFTKKRGICQDLAALTVAMLRSQGVHARIMIGYADKNYHAWVIAVIDGKEYMYDPTAAVGGVVNVKNYSVERYY